MDIFHRSFERNLLAELDHIKAIIPQGRSLSKTISIRSKKKRNVSKEMRVNNLNNSIVRNNRRNVFSNTFKQLDVDK